MQCKWLQCIWKLDIMNGQSVTNNRICGGNVMSQAKVFKLLSEAYGLTWSGGIAAEVIDGLSLIHIYEPTRLVSI